MVTTGLEKFISSLPSNWKKSRFGLLTNQASVDSRLVHNRLVLKKCLGKNLTTLFSPQHGFYSEQQDNMIESEGFIDAATGLNVYSLYGDVRKPTVDMMKDIDILLIDLQDVGTRVYTFLYTMSYCMERAAELGIKVMVLDRPNPVGGLITEGNLLEPECTSFVGLFPLPMRHGLTFGELALYINTSFSIGVDLEIICMENWYRTMEFRDTGLPWVFPSPNMPTPDTANVYPGQVLWEGTNVSEGRGTTLPFELFGAPFIDQELVLEKVEEEGVDGCFLRPILFQPTFGKWQGEVCKGFQIHVTDSKKFRSYRLSLLFYKVLYSLYGDEFSYKQPPYEYEFERLPMDLIVGSIRVRKLIETNVLIDDMEECWSEELEEFNKVRKEFFLYHN